MDVFEGRYNKLNEAQRKAVNTIDGPLLVVAGPGSGKTEILSLRVANILKQTDVHPRNILCLTFTDAAAVNMRKRLADIIGPDAYRVAIYTFHSFALSITERFPEYFYEGARFSAATELVQAEILESIFTNMAHDNPLRSIHPDQGFVYLRDVKTAISALKKAGLTPQEFREVLDCNKRAVEAIEEDIDQVFGGTVSTKIFDEVESLISKLKAYEDDCFPLPQFRPLPPALARSLEFALRGAQESGKATTLSNWKGQYTTNKEGKRVLKVAEQEIKLRALADVYEEYRSELHRQSYIDFDDMLLDTIKSIERNTTLKAELQEQFLYLLVDEFQDTNDAQMRLLYLLTETPAHQGAPNIMAVGDDDQAIYRFQGAEISNILYFKDHYPESTVITMTENYRSTQDVLNMARHVILQGNERLENLIPEMEKNLKASNPNVREGIITYDAHTTRFAEYQSIADRIKKILEGGEAPGEIAVIARRHRDLEALVPFLHRENIPVSYERQLNVFEEPHIRELIQMSRFIASLARKETEEADHLLPEILSYPFWNLDRRLIWDLSIKAQNREGDHERLWLDVMLESENKNLQEIAHFFLTLAERSLHEPLEYVLEDLVGAHIPLVPDTEDVDEDDMPEEREFVSPYKEHHFSREKFESNRESYVKFLSSLKVFVDSLREYKQGQIIKIDDLVRFVNLHENNGLSISDTSPFAGAMNAVTLTTVHKAKGLEFNTVFVLSAQEDVWAGRGKASLIAFPPNLPIAPSGDTIDDQLRLFYVALTRARERLFISSYSYTDTGREALPIPFLAAYNDVERVTKESGDQAPEDLLNTIIPNPHKPPFIGEENSILKHLVENYQLSVTHFNNFLDVTRGGPQMFLEQNLLRFPQPKSINGVFGSLMHTTLERMYLELKKNGNVPDIDAVLNIYDEELAKQRLALDAKDHLAKRGHDSLTEMYRERKDGFSPEHLCEYNFKHEGAIIDGAHITGKIDKIVKANENEMIVVDYKTGSAETKWSDNSVKLWRYKNQLLFYKLLVENSREFGGKYTVRKGTLEFLEPHHGKIVDLMLELDESDVERTKALIKAVCSHISNLNFPDIQDYPDTMEGIRKFEEDLLTQE